MNQATNEHEKKGLPYSLSENDLKYARCLAHRFFAERSHSQAEVEDIVSSAYLGLCQAASKFSTDKVDSLQTFSYLRIKGAMYDYLKESGGLPRTEYKKIVADESEEGRDIKKRPFSIAKSVNELTQMNSLIEQWGLSVHSSKHCTIDISYTNETLTDEMLCKKDLYKEVRNAIDTLPSDMKKLVYGHYFEGISLSKLIDQFPGRSKSYLCRLHKRSLRVLRDRLRDCLMEDRVIN